MLRYPKWAWAAAALAAGGAAAATSERFTFDGRYARSGLAMVDAPAPWAAGTSGRFRLEGVRPAADLNGNGIPDAWEAMYGLSGADAAADADPDGDGLTNLEEYNAGTDPTRPTKWARTVAESRRWRFDMRYDPWGLAWGTALEAWMASGRFLLNTESGRAKDSDGDGMPDWWERLYGLNPLVADGHLDSDGDGRTNLEEYNAGTNPLLADDWTVSAVASAERFSTDTRVWYTGGNPVFDLAFAVIEVSNGFVCDTGGLYAELQAGVNVRIKGGAGGAGLVGAVRAASAAPVRAASASAARAAAVGDGEGVERLAVALEPIVVEPRTRGGMGLLGAAERAPYALRWRGVKGRRYEVYEKGSLAEPWPSEPAGVVDGVDGVVEYVPEGGGKARFFVVRVVLGY